MKGMVESLTFYNPTLYENMWRGGGRRTSDQIGLENQGGFGGGRGNEDE